MDNIDQLLQELLVVMLHFTPRLIAALLTFGIALLLAGPAARAVQRSLSRRLEPQGLPRLLAKITRWAVVIGGGVIALEQVNFNVTGFLAGLGVAGLTIGFALQDITRNFVAGVLLMLRQPFVLDELITAGGFSGKVLDITIRDTMIQTLDGELVVIPNIKIFENPISNLSRSRLRQRNLVVQLPNQGDPAQALALLLAATAGTPGVLAAPQPTVWAEQLSEAAINVGVRFWVDTHTSDPLAVHSAVALALNRAINALPAA